MADTPPLALEYLRALRDDRTLTSTEKLYAMTIASHAGHDGTNAHPGHKLLGEETGTSERTSKRAVASLVDKGWLIQTSTGRGNSRYASVYRLAIPQSATHGPMGEPKCQMEHTKVPNRASQSATHGPTNPLEKSPREIPLYDGSYSPDREGPSARDEVLALELFREGFLPKKVRQVPRWEVRAHGAYSPSMGDAVDVWVHRSGWLFISKNAQLDPGPSGWTHGIVSRRVLDDSPVVDLQAA